MELGQVQEDYLEAIYVLREKSGQVKCVKITGVSGGRCTAVVSGGTADC